MTPAAVRHLFRSTPSLAQIRHRALLAVTGSQATQFLNGLLTTTIKPGVNQYSAFLHAQGRVMYDVFLYAADNGFILEYDPRESEATPLEPYLKRHVLRSKVKIRPVTDEYDIWTAWGSQTGPSSSPQSWTWARSGCVEPAWDSSGPWPWGTQKHKIQDARAFNLGHRLLVMKGDPPQEALSHETVSSEDYMLHRILHGVPEGIAEIIPMHAFPMESNLDIMDGLDFRKGCYVGQELTVRTYHTGVIRKRILPVYIHGSDQKLLENPPSFSPGADIKPISNLTSDGPRPRGTGKLLVTRGGVGLALLRLDHVVGLHKGELSLKLEHGIGESKRELDVTPWRPDWWPEPEKN